MLKLGLEKAEEPEEPFQMLKLPTSAGSQKNNPKTISTSASLTTLKPLTVWITTNCGQFLVENTLIPPDLPSGNLYAGQEATYRTGHGTMDWFQIVKGVHQGCILSLCLF